MVSNTIDGWISETYGIHPSTWDYVQKREKALKERFERMDAIRFRLQLKVLHAFRENRLSATDFYWTTGYGYGDFGREKAERIYAAVFGTEDALVRAAIASGTHALALCVQGILLPGQTFLSVTGTPYDTMQKVIGLKGNEPQSLREHGIEYREVPLVRNEIDIERGLAAVDETTGLILIQRSTGYSDRSAIPSEEIGAFVEACKSRFPDVPIMVDNCYGEFTELKEPTLWDVDIMAGSLIKNPGGGIAPAGGYIVGKRKWVERIANRMTAPGLGRDVGLSWGMTRQILQGLYFAPHVTSEALKTALLMGRVYEDLGFTVIPGAREHRADIIQSIQLGSPEALEAFCVAIQSASSIDAHVTPVPGDMPGYEDPVIMASGGFVDGSSIEISADGPMRPPYTAFYQGGLTYDQGKLAVLLSVQQLCDRGILRLSTEE